MADRNAWIEPGTYEVAPGVHRIPCPLPNDGLRAINVYALEEPAGGISLIDTGWRHPDSLATLEAGVARLGVTLADVRRIVCTHAHYDHYALAGHVRAQSGAPITLGRVDSELLSVTKEQSIYRRYLEHRRSWLISHGAEALVAEIEQRLQDEAFQEVRRGIVQFPDDLIEDGAVLEVGGRTLHAIMTSGHTRGHMVFHDREAGVLFAGDHVLPHITPSLGFEPFANGKSLERFLASLARVRDLPVTTVLPGHGPVFADLAGRVDELVAHHEDRLDRCVAILEAGGPGTAYAVAEGLPWTRHERRFGELTEFNRMLAVSETITHLELLADTGRAIRIDGPTVRYAAAAGAAAA